MRDHKVRSNSTELIKIRFKQSFERIINVIEVLKSFSAEALPHSLCLLELFFFRCGPLNFFEVNLSYKQLHFIKMNCEISTTK